MYACVYIYIYVQLDIVSNAYRTEMLTFPVDFCKAKESKVVLITGCGGPQVL
jgi:hypothetical protein